MIRYPSIYFWKHQGIAIFVYGVAFFIISAFIGSAWVGLIKSFRIALAALFFLFLSGFFTSLIFFPDHDTVRDQEGSPHPRALDVIERMTLSILLSIVISSIIVYVSADASLRPDVNPMLIPQYLALAVVSMSMIIGAIAFWRQQWMSFIYAIPIIVFPMLMYLLHWLEKVHLTKSTFMLGAFGLVIILGIIFAIRILSKPREPYHDQK